MGVELGGYAAAGAVWLPAGPQSMRRAVEEREERNRDALAVTVLFFGFLLVVLVAFVAFVVVALSRPLPAGL